MHLMNEIYDAAGYDILFVGPLKITELYYIRGSQPFRTRSH